MGVHVCWRVSGGLEPCDSQLYEHVRVEPRLDRGCHIEKLEIFARMLLPKLLSLRFRQRALTLAFASFSRDHSRGFRWWEFFFSMTSCYEIVATSEPSPVRLRARMDQTCGSWA